MVVAIFCCCKTSFFCDMVFIMVLVLVLVFRLCTYGYGMEASAASLSTLLPLAEPSRAAAAVRGIPPPRRNCAAPLAHMIEDIELV